LAQQAFEAVRLARPYGGKKADDLTVLHRHKAGFLADKNPDLFVTPEAPWLDGHYVTDVLDPRRAQLIHACSIEHQ
jgi:hypothetical protein